MGVRFKIVPFIKSILLLMLIGFLSSCYLGDKTHEHVDCPHNSAGDYEIVFSRNQCRTPSKPVTLKIPKEYSIRCVTRYPAPPEKPITNVGIIVSSPDFLPVDHPVTEKIKDNHIRIRISPLCEDDIIPYKGNKRSNEFASYIEKNKSYSNANGTKQFAPIAFLENGVYLQKNTREPYHPGNSDIYFYKDKNGDIPFMIDCNGRNECSASSNIVGAFNYNYWFQNMGYREFYNLNEKAKIFISSHSFEQ